MTAMELEVLDPDALREQRRAARAATVGKYHRSARGTVWADSPAPKGSGADWSNAKQHFALPSTADWVARFDRDENIMWTVLGDIWRIFTADQAKASGQGRTGRRPKSWGTDGNLTALEALITPRHSMEPFAIAVMELESKHSSARAFARAVPIEWSYYRRLVSGKYPLTMWWLEKMAKAGGVGPAFFKEWREGYILATLSQIMTERPQVSVGVLNKLKTMAR